MKIEVTFSNTPYALLMTIEFQQLIKLLCTTVKTHQRLLHRLDKLAQKTHQFQVYCMNVQHNIRHLRGYHYLSSYSSSLATLVQFHFVVLSADVDKH